ncbi:hypothetical protein FKP32DRAFT_1683251 [Trametes sanguinea]|nr:hypothetical protein FKP32DRAFT_1683251 [Trametes sanguinea]
MAQAWLYVGMAVRMAQDLGLHTRAEKWTDAVGGRSLFSKAELQERRRVWYGCVVMDKYVCAYIGRPVAICERDFDTELPLEEGAEEGEVWRPHPAPPVLEDPATTRRDEVVPAAGRIISCFNESAKLSVILSQICQSIYAIRPAASRPAELARLDSMLTKWSLELPEHLRFDPAAPKVPPPPPHILTLHMQYWCTVLLLHRPLYVFLSLFGAIIHTAHPGFRQAGARAQAAKPSDAPPPPSRGSVSEPRNKRAAEEPIEEDADVPERSRSALSQDSAYRPQTGYTLDMPHSAPPAPTSSYLPSSYDRWPTDSSALSSFSGSLSTSVLPQQYSTGLVDERMGGAMGRGSERPSARYPQYWNDYSALSQMETTYGVPVMGEMVAQHGGAQQGDGQSMYVQDQYSSMFGNMPPSSQ